MSRNVDLSGSAPVGAPAIRTNADAVVTVEGTRRLIIGPKPASERSNRDPVMLGSAADARAPVPADKLLSNSRGVPYALAESPAFLAAAKAVQATIR